MLFWLAIAGISGLVAAVLMFANRGGGPVASAANGEAEALKAQLRELDRDHANALVEQVDYDAARAEIARRLLRIDEDDTGPIEGTRRDRKATRLAIALGVPALAIAIYASLGQPDYADQPITARLDAGGDEAGVDVLVARIERHLAETGSRRAADILQHWDSEKANFLQVCPTEMLAHIPVPLSAEDGAASA